MLRCHVSARTLLCQSPCANVLRFGGVTAAQPQPAKSPEKTTDTHKNTELERGLLLEQWPAFGLRCPHVDNLNVVIFGYELTPSSCFSETGGHVAQVGYSPMPCAPAFGMGRPLATGPTWSGGSCLAQVPGGEVLLRGGNK